MLWLKNALATLKMRASLGTLLRFLPGKHAFVLKILRADEL